MGATGPELFREIRLERFGTRAYFVIDRFVWGTSWGGLRVIPDPDPAELCAGARAMTLKYGFVGLMFGGAKAALELPEHLQDDRAEMIFDLGKALSSELRSGRWIPGIDMGSTLEDIKQLYRGAGSHKDLSTWKDLSPLYTAWTVYFSTLAALEIRRERVTGKTFAVHGLGRVGSEYAKLMVKSGAVCIAASTRRGTIHNRHGLDINEILAEQQRSGELFPLTYTKGDHLTAESLLELEVDILVPAARSWAIHNGNVNGIRASIIPCAANAAMDLAVERKLFETGKIVVTDFVANCGGVFGSFLERYLQPSAIRRLLETNYYEKVTRLLKRSLKEGRTIGELAIEEATAKLRRADSIRQYVLVEFGRHILPFVPDILRRPALQRYCEWKFFKD